MQRITVSEGRYRRFKIIQNGNEIICHIRIYGKNPRNAEVEAHEWNGSLVFEGIDDTPDEVHFSPLDVKKR